VSIERKIKKRAERRALRVRSRVKKTGFPRVSVFRSLKQIYAQVIDDAAHSTVVSCSTLEVATKGDKSERAFAVGKELAERLLKQGVTKVTFDRGNQLFHGRVKAVADGLREGGVQL